MGEAAKPEQVAPPPAEEKVVEEKKEESTPPPPPPPPEEKEEEKPPVEEEKKAEEPPQPPPPFVLYVDLHCVGCAKKIERTIMKVRGVEGVAIDMGKNEVTIKGVVEPQAICNMIMKKIKRSAKVLSPLPANEGEPIPDVVTSQVSGLTTVELILNMHCEACAGQLKKKILKMRGVQTAETELSTGKVTVTGTMDANKLVDYVYRRTKKQAKIVPQPEPEPEKPTEEPKPEEAKEPEKPVEDPPNPEETKDENVEPNKEGGEEKAQEEQPKEVLSENVQENEVQKGGEMMMNNNIINMEDETMKRMMYNYNYNVPNYNYYNNYYQPQYVIERIPPPQLFSDENPNACCIS
ncbi:hypothetical protein RND81_12G144100 [Saponaria officinalis]|uniref:HMA domain-containing protein n=1 Tax=Saponaria officinalis TaxID=3572 RepID=A0AAW1HAI8_SAPOF